MEVFPFLRGLPLIAMTLVMMYHALFLLLVQCCF